MRPYPQRYQLKIGVDYIDLPVQLFKSVNACFDSALEIAKATPGLEVLYYIDGIRVAGAYVSYPPNYNKGD